MESSKLSGFKIQKTPIALGYMVTACGAQWIYGEKPGGAPSYRLMTLEPYRVKQENFDVIKEAQLYWTKLLIKISCDIDAIERLHAGTNDQTIKAFLSIARKVSQSTKKVLPPPFRLPTSSSQGAITSSTRLSKCSSRQSSMPCL